MNAKATTAEYDNASFAFNETGKWNESPLSKSEIIFLWIFVMLLAGFGIVANVVTFIVIAVNRELRNGPFNVMLMSLCVSDFISSIISPAILYMRTTMYDYGFIMPGYMCGLAAGLDHWTTIVTMQHILAFVIMRVIAFKKPIAFGDFKTRHAVIIVIIMWIETFAIGGWYLMVSMTLKPNILGGPPKRCGMRKNWLKYGRLYAIFGGPLFIYLPFLLIVVLSFYIVSLIILERKKRRKRRGNKDPQEVIKKENRALLQVILIVGSLILGYAVEIVFRVHSTVLVWAKGSRRLPKAMAYSYGIQRMITLRVSESLNPIFYNVANSNIRAHTIKLLRRLNFKANARVHNLSDDGALEIVEVKTLSTRAGTSDVPSS